MADLIEETEQKIEGKSKEEALETMNLKAGTINLLKPLLVNGKEIKVLKYDFEEIDIVTFKQANAFASRVPGLSMDGTVQIMENDYNIHLYLGFAAVAAVNPDITIRDLERIKGVDLNVIQEKGRNFTMGYVVARLDSSN